MNPVGTHMSGSGMSGTLGVQNMMQFKLLEMIKFDDPMMNMLVSALVLTMFTSATTLIPSLFRSIKSLITSWLYGWLFLNYIRPKLGEYYEKYLQKIVERWFGTKVNEKWIEFNVEEVHMTTKNLSTLFPAVYWYITNRLDLKKESPISYFKTEDIELNDNDKLTNKNLYKEVPNHKQVKFNFKERELIFSQSVKKETISGSEQKIEKDNTVLHFKVLVKIWEDQGKIQDEFVYYCMEEFAKNQKNSEWEQQIYNNNKGKWEKKKSENYRTLRTLALKEGQKEELVSQIDTFNNDEDFCKEMGIPWRIGFLLYGEPGTGKTSFILALSNYCKRDIYYLTMSSINDDTELNTLLNEINCRKGILVIEDIDVQTTAVHKRTQEEPFEKTVTQNYKERHSDEDEDEDIDLVNINEKEKGKKNNAVSKLSLSGILNGIDGIDSNHGRILLITSNNPKKLDRALLRHGRIDHKMYLSKANHYQITELYKKFFKQDPEKSILDKIEEDKISTAKITALFKLHRNNAQKGLEALLYDDDTVEEEHFDKLEKELK
jgi:AAA+ superfamily predicted ATPase